jgi:hypothetical protein
MESIKKLMAIICVVSLFVMPFTAFSDDQSNKESTVVEKSDTSTDTQQGSAPDTQATPQTPEPEAEKPAPSTEK